MPTVQFSMAPITGVLENYNIFSPMSYGAMGDNVTDDRVAVQACLNAASGVGVVLLDRMFLCKAKIFIPSNSEIMGLGWSTGLRFDWTLVAGQGGDVYASNSDTTNGNTNIRLSNFSFVGAGSGVPGGLSPAGCSGLLLRRGNSVQIRGVRFYRIPSISMAIQGISFATVSDNFVYQGGRDGIACRAFDGTPATDVVIANNVVREVGDDCIAISAEGDLGFGPAQPTRISVIGNTICGGVAPSSAGSGRGIFLFGAVDCSVVGNSVGETYDAGIYCVGDDTTALPTRNITIAGNIVRRAGVIGSLSPAQERYGIHVKGPAQEITIADNIIRETQRASIRLTDNAESDRPIKDVDIVNNQIIDGAQSGSVVDYGIYVVCATAGVISRVRIAGNRIVNNNGGGIRHQGPDLVTIENNTCINNGNSQSGATDTDAAGIICTGLGFAPTVIVRGNRCYDTRGASAKQTYGVVFATTAGAVGDATVEDNVLYGNQTAALQLNQTPTVLNRRNNRLSSGLVYGRAVLVAGTVTVNTAEVFASDNIHLTQVVTGGTPGHLSVGTIVAGTSFVINSSSGTDTSTVFWEIVH